MSKIEFSRFVSEQIGLYVYALRDPRDSRVFYIGKGKGNRVFEHAHAAKKGDQDAQTAKIALIRAIHADGKEVETIVLRHKISDTEAAYEIESALIGLLHLLDPAMNNDYFDLTNLVRGHHDASLGVMTTTDLLALYGAEKCPPIKCKAILFKIPRRWTPAMSQEEIYESTQGWWVLGPNREKAEYGFCISDGVIRQIYRIDSWRKQQKGDRGWKPGESKRWGFEGEIAHEMSMYINKSVRHLYKQGAANPAKYVNVK